MFTGDIILATAQAENRGEEYRTEIVSARHLLLADEPESYGGKDEAPSPAAYLCASLASCKAITLRMYVARKGWDVEAISVKVNLVKSEGLNTGNGFLCFIDVKGNISEEQKQRMIKIAEACPVQKLLSKGASISTVVV